MSKPPLRRLFDRLLLIPALVLVIGPVQTAAAAVVGDYFVSGSGNDMTGDGSQGGPWRTISKAAFQANAAGDTDVTIHVAEGIYDTDAGESFPISLDLGAPPAGKSTGRSFTLAGPGDGSAVVHAYSPPLALGTKGGGGGGGSPAPFLYAGSRFEGSLEVSGLTVRGDSSAVALAGGPPTLLTLSNGAEHASVHDNEVEGLGLLYAQTFGGEDCDVQVSNNVVVNSIGPAIYMVDVVSSATTGAAPVTRGTIIEGNTFFRDTGGTPAIYAVKVVGQGNALLDVEINNNTIDGGGGVIIDMGVSESEVDADLSFEFQGNDFIDTFGALNCSLVASASGELDAALEISNNTISALAGPPNLLVNTAVSSGAQVNVDLLIEGNESAQGGLGLVMDCEVSDAEVVRNVIISNNEISGANSAALVLSTEVGGIVGELDQSLVLDGNSITQNFGYGLYLAHDLFGAEGSLDAIFTKNDISYNGSGGGKGGAPPQVKMDFEGSSCDISLGFHGNVMRVDEGSSLADFRASGSSAMQLTLDGGGPLLGYNTFSPIDTAAADSLFFSVSSSVSADLNLNGNWWGTTDAVAIEDMVVHGADVPRAFAEVDLSNPLADGLEFEASKSGNKIRLTASEGSGFVAYAGSTLIEVTVDGVVEDDVTVADDYGSLTFPKSGYSGSVTICVTNPGGQSGCTTFTVPSSGGGGCGVMPVNGGTPNAGQFFAQYFLLLLPMLLLLRRRMRGVRPQPVGYAA